MCIEPSSVLTFIQRFYQKRLTTVHTHIHKPTAESTTQADSRWSGAVRMRRLAQGHLHTQLGGAGDQTSNLPVSSHPALPPELSLCSAPCLRVGDQLRGGTEEGWARRHTGRG